eukprot:CAMPEP_0184320936 /NCGR_PEP_ID=MMETSP1049-20130417/116556_1 /TAXON_ID=77928 /ORGANISM="Proteomonas sulcata, Strain CCMP704" /LENGTH=34 /DNA_ID= /DNA_START= /DNA_END= /DNA_ORIENTATION=
MSAMLATLMENAWASRSPAILIWYETNLGWWWWA